MRFKKVALSLLMVAMAGFSFAQTQERAYFPYQGYWLGADGGYSVDLGNGTSIWLLDDSFINVANDGSRSNSFFVHNTVAITPHSSCPWNTSSCGNANYYWNTNVTPIFNQDLQNSSYYYWPLDGFMYNGTLYVVLNQVYNSGSNPFPPTVATYIAKVPNAASTSPWNWNLLASDFTEIYSGGAMTAGVSMIVNQGPSGNPFPSDPNGASYAYFLSYVAAVGSTNSFMVLLRLPLSDLTSFGDLKIGTDSNWQYFNSVGSFQAWPTGTTVPSNIKHLITTGFTEGTLRYHAASKQWIAIYAADNNNQNAPVPTSASYQLAGDISGNYGGQKTLYGFPEMTSGNSEYDSNATCYAVKEHTELENSGGPLVFTYACNGSDVYTNLNLYRPEIVGMSLPSK
jgi:hypothetical protein